MASKRKKDNKAAGVIIGPIFVIASVTALWKNETRFDYHKAAAKTEPAMSLDRLEPGRNFSYSGEMDQSLTLARANTLRPLPDIWSFTGMLKFIVGNEMKMTMAA